VPGGKYEIESIETPLISPRIIGIRFRRVSVRENQLESGLQSRLRRGEPEALREVYERYADDVYRLALRVTASPADAYDVAHDVFVGLPEAATRYDPDRPFDAWIKGVAVRTALMRVRSMRRRREVSVAPLARLGVRSEAGRTIDRLTLEKALERLPVDLRTVFVLREIEGLAYQEIADVLGIKKNAAAVRLHRARGRLRDILRGEA
jgi:RNA polymerase sigma-70 factor (ECF subfamily)